MDTSWPISNAFGGFLFFPASYVDGMEPVDEHQRRRKECIAFFPRPAGKGAQADEIAIDVSEETPEAIRRLIQRSTMSRELALVLESGVEYLQPPPVAF